MSSRDNARERMKTALRDYWRGGDMRTAALAYFSSQQYRDDLQLLGLKQSWLPRAIQRQLENE